MNKRRKAYVKARNIVRNNMERNSNMVPNLTSSNVHLVIKAYNLFQKSRSK